MGDLFAILPDHYLAEGVPCAKKKNIIVPTRWVTTIKLRNTLVTLVPKLQLGNPDDEALASRDGKLRLHGQEMIQSFLCIPHIPVGYAGGRATQEQLPRASHTEFPSWSLGTSIKFHKLGLT